MSWRHRRRHVLLFLCTIMTPAFVLIGLTARIVRQEAELSEARIQEERRHELQSLRRELSTKLDEIASDVSSATRAGQPSARLSGVVFIASIEDGKFVPPWPVVKSKQESARFAQSVQI